MTGPIPLGGLNEAVLETTDPPAAEHFSTQVPSFPVLDRGERGHWAGREALWVLTGATRIGIRKPALGIGTSSSSGPGMFAKTPPVPRKRSAKTSSASPPETRQASGIAVTLASN